MILSRLNRLLDKATVKMLTAFIVLSLFAFACCYYLLGGIGHGLSRTYDTTHAIDLVDALYFSVITFTSLGFGDIRPVGISRLLCCIEVLFGLAFLGVYVAKLASAKSDYLIHRLDMRDVH